ncbi:hypothetical protein [Bauldia litoralis]|uniref:hypothetical protein n=1 Tax=Bauldia litoralis TaxID=665467 RepID=UPI003263289A
MTSDGKPAAKPTARQEREARLASALRDNLRRRKAAGTATQAETGAEAAARPGETDETGD